MYMWFAREFVVPKGWVPSPVDRSEDGDHKNGGRGGGSRVLLMHFEAIDYEATVFVNGHQVGFHRGGYFRFTVDITEVIKLDDGGVNELYGFFFSRLSVSFPFSFVFFLGTLFSWHFLPLALRPYPITPFVPVVFFYVLSLIPCLRFLRLTPRDRD